MNAVLLWKLERIRVLNVTHRWVKAALPQAHEPITREHWARGMQIYLKAIGLK
jgi:hypothetical protein